MTESDPPTPNQNKDFFSYTDALIFFGLMIVEHFVLAWLDLSTGTYLTILAASILGIIAAKLFWRILTR